MELTIFVPIGLVLVAVLFLAREKLKWAFFMFMGSLLLGGAAFVNLPALGGSSILIAHFHFGVLLMAAILLAQKRAFGEAAAIHIAGILLAVWCVVISFFGPRLFRGVEVIALSGQTVGPLAPGSGNITQAFYFCGTVAMAWLATALFRSKLRFKDLRDICVVLGLLNALCALIDVVLRSAGVSGPFDFVRNANYVMAEQNFGDIKRASGTFPEPSSYAAFAVPLMVMLGETWLQKHDRLAGWTAIAVAGGIVLSLSSAGLFGIGIYAVIMSVRLLTSIMTPHVFGRLLALVGALAFGAFLSVLMVALFPSALGNFTDALSFMTVQKSSGDSAHERTRWALQGVEMFQTSFGFGVGAGSFRSSSVATAILGSFGVIGAVFALLWLLPVALALGRRGPDAVDQRIAAWAAFAALLPPLLIAPGPDLGFMYAVFAGCAMARRKFAYHARPPMAAEAPA
jgi:hypothetical protein